jgi:PIN domain nuclease of toxin-antitoxin system
MSEVIVLDTHIWLWLIHGKFDRFPSHWVKQIQETNIVGVSPVSCYEIALASSRGRINLSRPVSEWFTIALAPANIQLLPIDDKISICAVNLSPIHKDPFDRLIIATALCHQARLASVDSLFPKYPELEGRLLSS